MGVNDQYDAHLIETLEEMLSHIGFSSFIFQNDPHNYGNVLAIGQDIDLVNTAGLNEMPVAGFTHGSTMTPHFFGGGALTGADFTAILQTPSVVRLTESYL
jgi:hypothetical protein